MTIVKLRKHKLVPNRDAFIVERCRNKRVLHIGPCDWPYTQKRLDENNLLYEKIDKVCEKQVGIDIDREGANFLNQSQSYPNSHIKIIDMNELHEFCEEVDVIIFGETLEHLTNAGVALNSLRELMQRTEAELIISVPNAYYIRNFIYAFFGKEYQHPDHSLAFTYKTLKQLLGKLNIEVCESYFSHLPAIGMNLRGQIVFWVLYPFTTLSPMLASRLLFVCHLK